MDTQTQAVHHAKAWQARSTELARWAWARLVNRVDHWAAVLPHRKRVPGQEAKAVKGKLKEHHLAKHFAGHHVRDLVGLPSMSAPGSRMSDIQPPRTCRWFAFDIGRPTEGDTALPGDNFHAALMWHEQLKQQHLEPLLEDRDGNGWYRITVLLDEPIDVGCVCAFVDDLVGTYGDLGLVQRPTTYPDWGCIDGDGLDNWLALPGRHALSEHLDYFSAVWDGDEWQRGHAAIDALIGTPTSAGSLLRRAEQHPGMDMGYQAAALTALTQEDAAPPADDIQAEPDEVEGELDPSDQTALETDMDEADPTATESTDQAEPVEAMAHDDMAGALADAFEQVAQVQTQEDEATAEDPPVHQGESSAISAAVAVQADEAVAVDQDDSTEHALVEEEATNETDQDPQETLVRSLERMDEDIEPDESPSLFEPTQSPDDMEPTPAESPNIDLANEAMLEPAPGDGADIEVDLEVDVDDNAAAPGDDHETTEPAIVAEPAEEPEAEPIAASAPDPTDGLNDTAIESAFDALCDLVKEFSPGADTAGHTPPAIPIPEPSAENDGVDATAPAAQPPHPEEETLAMSTQTQAPPTPQPVPVATTSPMPDDARAMVEQIADRTGMREDQIVKRIFEWVGQQDEVVQAVILGQIPEAIRPDVWDLITKQRNQGE